MSNEYICDQINDSVLTEQCWKLQCEEIQALSAIYGDDFRLLSKTTLTCSRLNQEHPGITTSSALPPKPGPSGLTFRITIFPYIGNEGVKVIFPAHSKQKSSITQDLDGIQPSNSFPDVTVRHIPPAHLFYHIPRSYPELSLPQVSLECKWAPQSVLQQKLSQVVAQLWNQQPGVLCYEVAQHVYENLLHWAGAVEEDNGLTLNLSQYKMSLEAYCFETQGKGKNCMVSQSIVEQKCRTDHHKKEVKGHSQVSDEHQTERVIVPIYFKWAADIYHQLCDYDARETEAQFLRTKHKCDTCLEQISGQDMVRLGNCVHYQCRWCVQRMVYVHLGDGSVDALRCHTCGVGIDPAVVRAVAGPEAAEVFDAKLLQNALDKMPDGLYCPRCNTICIRENGNMAACFCCGYVFCTDCFKGWHPGSTCVTLPTHEDEATTSSACDKARNMESYEINEVRVINESEQQALSMLLIKLSTWACPKCETPILKSSGCDKVICAKCGCWVCYRCSKNISMEGYEHFQNGSCVVVDKPPLLYDEPYSKDSKASNEASETDFLWEDYSTFRRRQKEIEGLWNQRQRACKCPSCNRCQVKISDDNCLRCVECGKLFCYICNKEILCTVLEVEKHYIECKRYYTFD